MERRFDIMQAAGGRNRAVMKECKGVSSNDGSEVESVAGAPGLTARTVPMISGLEVVREHQSE